MNEADPGREGGPVLMSIGHSTHPPGVFVDLLQRYGVEVVVDVRTSPFSRFNPQFNRDNLRLGLREVGIRYIFLGEELGGKPDGDEFYDPDGHVLYGRLAETPLFESGLMRLIDGAKRFRVAIMCSEEDPSECHRFLLVTRVLQRKDVEVTHIRGDGNTERTEEVSTFGGWSDPVHEEQSLFDTSVRSPWRSTRSVSRRSPPPRSSKR